MRGAKVVYSIYTYTYLNCNMDELSPQTHSDCLPTESCSNESQACSPIECRDISPDSNGKIISPESNLGTGGVFKCDAESLLQLPGEGAKSEIPVFCALPFGDREGEEGKWVTLQNAGDIPKCRPGTLDQE